MECLFYYDMCLEQINQDEITVNHIAGYLMALDTNKTPLKQSIGGVDNLNVA